MIVTIISSYAGVCRKIPCHLLFSTDWLRDQFIKTYSLNKSTTVFSIEKQRVDGGTIGDYVKGKQTTAYASVWLDFSGSNAIRCSVQCGSFLRILEVSPADTLLSAIQSMPISQALHSDISDLSVEVGGKRVDITSKAGDCLQYGSVLSLSFSGRPLKPVAAPIPEDAIQVFIADDYGISIPTTFLSSDHPLDSLSDAVSSLLHIAPSYFQFTDMNGHSATFPCSSLRLRICIHVRDSMNAIHDYYPQYFDTVQMVVTDIQNCPFVQLPMKVTVDKVDVDPNTYIWNLLEEEVVLRATERTEDVDVVRLKEDAQVFCEDSITGSHVMTIPENAILVVEEKATSRNPVYTVEYDGHHGLEVAPEICEEVQNVDYVNYEEPIVKRAVSDWESNCPYQLSVKRNQSYLVSMENDDYFYGTLMGDPSSGKEGWIQKSLLAWVVC